MSSGRERRPLDLRHPPRPLSRDARQRLTREESPIEKASHSRVAGVLIHAGGLGLVGLLLITAGGPIATDDVWWHLELGELYRQFGPWLTEDPRLHTALGPPAPNAWLFDLFLAASADAASLFSLRVLHVAIVTTIVVLTWRALMRASGSAALASLSTALFVACSSYRLTQLRPELATIAATLALYLLVLEPRALSRRRIAGAIVLCGLWANLHPGYLLGPVLIFATATARAIHAGLGLDDPSGQNRGRAMRLAFTGAAALLASAFNPDGFAALAHYGQAGVDAARAGLIVDEWRSLDLLEWPSAQLPPTPIAWACLWLILPLALWLLCRECIDWVVGARGGRRRRVDAIDPGLLALAAAGVLAPFVAVRFVWLCFFPLLLIASEWRYRELSRASTSLPPARRERALGWLGSTAMLVLLVGYAQSSAVLGSTSLITALIAPRPIDDRATGPHPIAAFASAYDADRYYAHAVWFLRDSGVEGRLFNPYFAGGFFEYWLSPHLQAFADGSLNFSDEVLRDHALILTQGADLPDFDLGARLDRYGIDFFVGVGLPTLGRPGRPWRYSSHHLERDRDWILVYRGLRSAVYMRRSERNQSNLEHIAAYYANAGVPFSRDDGLDVFAALEGATVWSIENGLAPIDYPELVQASTRAAPRRRAIARQRLASTYAALGLYERVIEIDSTPQPNRPGVPDDPGRELRLAWSLMRLDHTAEALSVVRGVEAKAEASRASVRGGLQAYAEARSDEARARIAAMTPVFSPRETGQLKAVERPAVARAQFAREDSGTRWNRTPTAAR